MTETSAELAAIIAERVKRRRKEARMSLSELAARSGLARATIHGIERGRGHRVSVATLLRLADALALPPDALLGRDLSRVNVTEPEQLAVLALRRIYGDGQ